MIDGCAEVIMPTLSADSFDLVHSSPPCVNTELYKEDGHGKNSQLSIRSGSLLWQAPARLHVLPRRAPELQAE